MNQTSSGFLSACKVEIKLEPVRLVPFMVGPQRGPRSKLDMLLRLQKLAKFLQIHHPPAFVLVFFFCPLSFAIRKLIRKIF